jgi:Leucine-rich repeat (LRR) protein
MMEGLLLDNNNLQALPELLFSGLSNMRTIDLSYNKLVVMPTGLLRGLTSLSSFQIQGNPDPVPQQLPSTCAVG